MQLNKHTQAAFATIVMTALAFGSLPSSKRDLTTTEVPSLAGKEEQPSSASIPTRKEAIDPEAQALYDEQIRQYESALSEWQTRQDQVPILEKMITTLKAELGKKDESKPQPKTYEEQDWVSANGDHTTRATIIDSDYKVATLKKEDGSIVKVEKSKLSDKSKAMVESTFVEKEIFEKKLAAWNEECDRIRSEIQKAETDIKIASDPKPTAPNLDSIVESVMQKRLAEKNRKEKEEAERKVAEKRKQEEAAKKRAEEYFEKNGLELEYKSLTGEITEFGITIKGIVRNTTKRKLTYAEITFQVYDKSGAQVATAIDNITGIDPGGVWKFSAVALAGDAHKYKLEDMKGF